MTDPSVAEHDEPDPLEAEIDLLTRLQGEVVERKLELAPLVEEYKILKRGLEALGGPVEG